MEKFLIELRELKDEKLNRTEMKSNEYADVLQKDLDAYKERVATINTQEELDEEEKYWLEQLEKNDAYLKEVKYELPKNVTFGTEVKTRGDIAGKIIYYISKTEVTWQYCLGLYELCNFWKHTENTEITYGAFDSTLRLLDQVKYKGYGEWKDILIINEYFKPMHEEYTKDLMNQTYLAQMHNEVIKRRDLIEPVHGDNTVKFTENENAKNI